MWKYFFLGLLVGWLIEWIIDWLYWRRDSDIQSPSEAGQSNRALADAAAGPSPAASVGPGAAVLARGAPQARDLPRSAPPSAAMQEAAGPVYRQEDLEAIAGIGPKIGAMLRNNGITTFAELAGTPVAELIRIVESTGEQPGPVGLESWAEQATLAAAQDWAGFAAVKRELLSQAAGGRA